MKYFFFQNSIVYYLFFIFLLFLTFIFYFVYLYLSTYSRNFYIFFILWIRHFIIKFWKIMEHFSKKYRHLKSKIPQNVHRLLFVFYFLFFQHFGNLFFPISPIQTCQKIPNIFVLLYGTDYRFYQRILEILEFLLKK